MKPRCPPEACGLRRFPSSYVPPPPLGVLGTAGGSVAVDAGSNLSPGGDPSGSCEPRRALFLAGSELLAGTQPGASSGVQSTQAALSTLVLHGPAARQRQGLGLGLLDSVSPGVIQAPPLPTGARGGAWPGLGPWRDELGLVLDPR